MGGTSIKVATAKPTNDEANPYEILNKKIVVTSDNPDECIQQICDFFAQNGPISSLGIASFGPLCLNKASSDYGSIMNTPKYKWIKYSLVKQISNQLDSQLDIDIDTDVNAAAKFEFEKGGHKATKNLAYVTIGTGVGVGFVINGQTVTGLTHPEGGHMMVARHPDEIQGFEKGVCMYHDHCIEGYCTNVSIANRYNISVHDLPNLKDSDKVWDLVAYYIAVLCMNVTL